MSTIDVRITLRRPDFACEVDLTLPGRGISAVLGPSGAGKTSLLRAIAGLERARGYVQVNGEVWQDDDAGIFVPPYRRALGYVFQEASLLPHLNVQRNLEFGWKRALPASRSIDWQHILALLDIAHLLGRRPHTLSGGERQRVAIARALLACPKLLLMDEPLASLDLARKEEVLPYLERMHAELAIPVIYVSHAPDEVARLADHVIVLETGKVVASGPIADIMTRTGQPDAFGHDTSVVLEGTVESCDATYGLAQVRIGAVTLRIAHEQAAAGARLRLLIRAEDVGLALAPHDGTSALNQLPATIVAVESGQPGSTVLVRLDAGGMPLLARIPRLSADCLQLAAGKQVWAQFSMAEPLALTDAR